MTQAKTTTPLRPASLVQQATANKALRYNRSILIRSFAYLRPYWGITLGAYAMGVAVTGLAIIVPQFIRWIVDEGIAAGRTDLLGWAVLGLLGITLLKGYFVYLQGVWSEIASQNVAYDLRNAIHQHLLDLSFAYHDHSQAGQLLSRSIQDVERIRFLTGRATMRLFEAVTLLVATIVILIVMNWELAVLGLASMPLLGYVAYRAGYSFRPLSVQSQQQMAVMTTVLEQNLRGTKIVRAYAQEPAEIERFETENRHWFALERRLAWILATHMPLIDLLASLSTVIIIWYGGGLVIRDRLSIGELVAFTTYLSQLSPLVRRMGVIIPAIAMASAAGERIFEILDAPSEVASAETARELPPIQGHVCFENVSFAYAGREKALENISFEAHPGQIIALLGATGSGKSTIINLIPRFYETSSGRITIDGHDIREVSLRSLRSQIGIVLQDTTLFAATIFENIVFGRPGATLEEVQAAAQAAQAHEFIMATPRGYDTEVGERGVTLSGGQQQRIAIARALLKDPRILLLDDATASVDTETEHLIQLALEKLMEGRTSFVIAQRLSTVRMANAVLVLEKGHIVARGTHASLMQESAFYREIYERQLRQGTQESGE